MACLLGLMATLFTLFLTNYETSKRASGQVEGVILINLVGRGFS